MGGRGESTFYSDELMCAAAKLTGAAGTTLKLISRSTYISEEYVRTPTFRKTWRLLSAQHSVHSCSFLFVCVHSRSLARGLIGELVSEAPR